MSHAAPPSGEQDRADRSPDPAGDWLDQGALARVLGISPRTASIWARQGRLRLYEHGVLNCGRRRYSRQLVERERQRCWAEAVKAQDEQLSDHRMMP